MQQLNLLSLWRGVCHTRLAGSAVPGAARAVRAARPRRRGPGTEAPARRPRPGAAAGAAPARPPGGGPARAARCRRAPHVPLTRGPARGRPGSRGAARATGAPRGQRRERAEPPLAARPRGEPLTAGPAGPGRRRSPQSAAASLPPTERTQPAAL